jgi:hypothetical protein
MHWLLFFALSVTGINAGREPNRYAWNTSDQILPWESYLQIGEVTRPFGLELNRSSIVHHHFAIGHLCLHSFMYDIAQDAFNLALSLEPTFIEAHIGKILGYTIILHKSKVYVSHRIFELHRVKFRPMDVQNFLFEISMNLFTDEMHEKSFLEFFLLNMIVNEISLIESRKEGEHRKY